MKVRLLIILALALVLQGIFFGVASAEYVPGNDVTINITVDPQLASAIPTGLAAFSFRLQQELIQRISSQTGQDIDYYYIWIQVNGKTVLAIDPPCALY